MSYQLEKILLEDQNKILKDLGNDTRKKNQLLARGGYFNNQPGLKWSIDKGNNNYLFIAPKLDIRSPQRDYFFYFKEVFYRIHVASRVTCILSFDDPVPLGQMFEELKADLYRAFKNHRFSGRGPEHEPIFLVKFEEV